MNTRVTCKQCGQLCQTSAKITKIENEEHSRKIVLEFTSQVDRDRNLLDAFTRIGIKVSQSGNALTIEAEDVVTDEAPETTATESVAPEAPKAAKRRGRPPVTSKDD